MQLGNAILPAWVKWAGLGIGLALLIWLVCWLNVTYFINPAVNAETARWQQRWDKRDNADLAARQAFTDDQRRIELQRQANADKLQKEAENEIARISALRAAADRNALRLQNGIADAITKLQSGRGEDPGAGTGSKAGNSTSNLLAELFREIDTAAGDYAAEADRARAAGLTCEKQWDELRKAQ